MKTLLVILLTLFSVSLFSQTTYTFTLYDGMFNGDYETNGVVLGDTINFVNGEGEDGIFMTYLNGTNVGTFIGNTGSVFYTYNVTSTNPFNIVFNKFGFSYPYSYYFTVTEQTSGIIENSLEYSLYPNPTTDFLNIDGFNIESVRIFDLSGKLLLESKTNLVDLRCLTRGFYMVLVNENKSILIRKE